MNFLPSYSPIPADGADINLWLGHHPQGLLFLLTILTHCRNPTSFLFHLLLFVPSAKPEVIGPKEVLLGSQYQADQTGLRN